MNQTGTLVSVLMTTYNREKYIAEAIESVLASTYTNFELVIADDASSDKTLSIVKGYAAKDQRIKIFVNEKNIGDYPNRNKAASHAKGVYLKYLDADDLIYPWGLEVMVNAMLLFPQAGFGLSSKVSDFKPFPLLINPSETYKEHFNGYGHFSRSPGSSIIKRDLFGELGGFSGRKLVSDQEFWFKIARYYPMVKFPFDLYWNRQHPEQQSEFERKNQAQITKLREEIVVTALDHPDCPLNENEIKKIKNEIHKKKWKNSIRKIINSMNPLR